MQRLEGQSKAARALNLKRAEFEAGAPMITVVTYVPEASFGMPETGR